MTVVARIARVSRDNFSEALASVLGECRVQLRTVQEHPSNSRLFWDLTAAVQALEQIEKEIREGKQRAKGQRSAAFTRYVIDEGPQMVMDAQLRELIIQIEDVYARYGNL